MAKFIEQENPKRAAGVFLTDAFGQEFARVLAERMQALGSPFVARDDADPQIQSFKSLIARWKSMHVDLLVTTLSDRQQVTLLREMREQGFKPKIFSTYNLECFAPPAAARALYEGIKYTHPVNSAGNSQKTRAIEAELAKREKPGQGSNINALFAYDGLGFLWQGIQKCKAVDAACLYAYFTHLGMQQGVSGQMRFEPSGALTRPYGLKTVANGEFVWLERSSL